MGARGFTRDELNLLLYLETCLVDGYGLVDMRKVNADDVRIARAWDATGFIRWRRVPGRLILDEPEHYRHKSTYVQFTDHAWQTAHAERRSRADRMGLPKEVVELVG